MIDASGSAWLWPLVAAPFVGSFLGVLITRLPSQIPFILARSACRLCGTRLGGLDLVPLASFLLLRGRCRHCGAPIGLFHPMVELAAAAVALWAIFADPAGVWVDCGVGWTLLTLAWIDWTALLLPDVLTLPLLLAGLTWTRVCDPDALADHCLAAILGYLSFQGLAYTYRRLRNRDGLGGGDAKLIAAAGAWCGLAALPWAVLISALLGLLAALAMAVAGRTITVATRIPFGPCIALAFWMVWLYGTPAEGLLKLLGRP